MKYVITRLNKRNTRAGKPFASVSLEDERGQELDKVSVWSDFPGFEELDLGTVVSGKVETNERGYKNLKAGHGGEDEQSAPSIDHRHMPRRDMRMVRTPDEYRAELIRMAQARKNDSIAYFNATNAAIELISSLQPKLLTNFNRTTLKHEIGYWREWFLEEWKKHEADMRERQHASS